LAALMTQNENLDLFGRVGAGVQHYPAHELREHLVDQLQRRCRLNADGAPTATCGVPELGAWFADSRANSSTCRKIK
jgi:hypothetical protein